MMQIRLYIHIIFIFFLDFRVYALSSDKIVFFIPNSTKPWLQNASADVRYTFNTAILGQLIYVNSDFDLHSDVLDSFFWDFKKNRYILKLKRDLYFHNGRKVNIHDFEFSLVRPYISKSSNESSMLLINLKGIEKLKHGQKFHSGMLDGIKVLDDLTLAVTPSTPNPTFLYTLSRSNYALVPMEELTSDLLDWKKWPIGVGPYKITDANDNDSTYYLSLVDSKNFPNAPKEIEFEQKRVSEPDLSIKDIYLANNSHFKQKIISTPSWKRVITFNFKNKYGENPLFRKAISLALQRQNISRKVRYYNAKPLFEVITPHNIGQIKSNEEYNIFESRNIFKKVLSKNSSFIFKIPYTPDSNMGSEYRAEIVTQLKDAGLNIQFVESSNIWDPFSVEFSESPFRLISLGADFFDPLLAFTYFIKNSPLLNQHPVNWNFDEQFLLAQSSPSRDVLYLNLQNLTNIIIKNNVLVPLFYIPTVIYFNENKIKFLGEQYGGNVFFLSHIEIKK